MQDEVQRKMKENMNERNRGYGRPSTHLIAI
jgi:hypothetical protein